MTTNNKILKIYKSRKTILDILDKHLDYETTDYENFSINEIDAMYSNNQLDMLVKQKKTNKKTYIKYYLNSKQIRPQNLENIIDDLFYVENVLEKTDDLIIIMEEEPNDTIQNKLEYLFNQDGIFIVLHNINRLQFNILEHDLVPETKILPDDQHQELMKKYNLKTSAQLPQIGRFDPLALILCLRPGQIIEITRESMTSIFTKFYRVCV